MRLLHLILLFYWLTLFVFLDVLNFFQIVRNRNMNVLISSSCCFCDIWILFVGFWGLMEVMFSSWILLIELSGAHTLKTSRLKRRDSGFDHEQTFFVEGSISNNYICFFVTNTFCLFDMLNLSHIVPYRNLAVWILPYCLSVISWFCSSVIGVLWWSHSRGPCHIGYLAPTNWEPLTWNIKTPVSITCKKCFWNGLLSHIFFRLHIIYFWWRVFCLSREFYFFFTVWDLYYWIVSADLGYM